LEHSKPGKIVRSLCLLRNGFMNNFSRIVSAVNGSHGISAGIHVRCVREGKNSLRRMSFVLNVARG
ncbi:MAG: hypothetical protein PUJ11_06880, partial [Eubacteriaceae bacterium]|nr:hypothetical protein [Eubacteriaceae bacterium]